MMKGSNIVAIIMLIIAIVFIITGFVLKNNDKEPEEDTGMIIIDDGHSNKLNEFFNSNSGIWYEKEGSLKEDYPDLLNIKSIDKDKIVFDLRINNVRFDNINSSFNDFTGSFNGISDNNIIIEGQLTYDFDNIRIIITKSNDGIINTKNYVFKYHVKPGSLASYIGKWYEAEEMLERNDPNMIYIKKIDGNKITFDFVGHLSDYCYDITSNLINNSGTFNHSLGENGAISGNISLENNIIVLKVNNSNVRNVSSNSEYTFKYQKTNY